MNELQVIVLSIHCNLASLNVLVNEIPLYQSSPSEHKFYASFVLNPHLKEHTNSLTLTVKNDWSEPERVHAFCAIELIEQIGDSTKVLETWRYAELERSINFKPLTETLTFSTDTEVSSLSVESISADSIDLLIDGIAAAIERKDIDLLLNGYLISGLYSKYHHSGLTSSQWMTAETALWRHWLSEPFSLVQSRDTRLDFSHGLYTRVAGENGKEPIVLQFDWGAIGLGFITSMDHDAHRIIRLDYAITEIWKK